jgi:hypothetical protein
MKQKTLVLSPDCTLLRVTVRCPHGESADFEFPTPSKSDSVSERRWTLAQIIRNNRKAWKLIEQGKSIFGRCNRCMSMNGHNG